MADSTRTETSRWPWSRSFAGENDVCNLPPVGSEQMDEVRSTDERLGLAKWESAQPRAHVPRGIGL